MKHGVIAAAMLTLAAAGSVAATSDADMARCAAIRARDARLDCYDALAQQSANKAAAPPAASQPAPLPAPAAPPAASALVPAAAAAPATAASSGAAAPATPATPMTVIVGDPKNFGLTAAQQHTVDVGPKMITASIASLGADQTGAALIVLDNGQTWSVADNDGWIAAGQAVRIRRAAMGSYLMLIPSNHSYHVRRLR